MLYNGKNCIRRIEHTTHELFIDKLKNHGHWPFSIIAITYEAKKYHVYLWELTWEYKDSFDCIDSATMYGYALIEEKYK